MSIQLLSSVRCTKRADAAENAPYTWGTHAAAKVSVFISTEVIWMFITVSSLLGGENVHSWVQCFCSSKGKRKVVSAIYGRIWSHYWTLAHFFPGFFLLRQTKAALAAFRRSMTGMLEDSDGKKRLGHSLFHYLILVNRFIVELLSKMFYLFIWNKHHPTGRRWYQERREFLQ